MSSFGPPSGFEPPFSVGSPSSATSPASSPPSSSGSDSSSSSPLSSSSSLPAIPDTTPSDDDAPFLSAEHPWAWVLIPIGIVVAIGILAACLHTSRRRRRRQARRASSFLDHQRRRHRSSSLRQNNNNTTPTAAATPPSGDRDGGGAAAAARSSSWDWAAVVEQQQAVRMREEGLNELGEAPPPYEKEVTSPGPPLSVPLSPPQPPPPVAVLHHHGDDHDQGQGQYDQPLQALPRQCYTQEEGEEEVPEIQEMQFLREASRGSSLVVPMPGSVSYARVWGRYSGLALPSHQQQQAQQMQELASSSSEHSDGPVLWSSLRDFRPGRDDGSSAVSQQQQQQENTTEEDEVSRATPTPSSPEGNAELDATPPNSPPPPNQNQGQEQTLEQAETPSTPLPTVSRLGSPSVMRQEGEREEEGEEEGAREGERQQRNERRGVAVADEGGDLTSDSDDGDGDGDGDDDDDDDESLPALLLPPAYGKVTSRGPSPSNGAGAGPDTAGSSS